MKIHNIRRPMPSCLLCLVLLLTLVPQASAQDAQAESNRFIQALPNVASVVESQKTKVVAIRTLAQPQLRNAVPDAVKTGPLRPLGQGSGFIVDPTGYILTNYHVLKGAQRVEVQLQNDKRAYQAELIGSDPKTDVALIKIEAKRPLPFVKIGKSKSLKIGQWVVAIGNPFGLDYSVTSGIVSAKGRNLGNSPYDDFLQTDASINPGNSGGPLFNMRGEVIGMNTAIIRNGQGIGFAVPSDLLTRLLPQLRDKGYVVRGYLGADLQALTKNLAESFAPNLGANEGVLISGVAPKGPASQAGLQAGDIIRTFNNVQVETLPKLFQLVADTEPGTKVDIEFLRQGKLEQQQVIIKERPDTVRRAKKKKPRKPVANSKLGLRLANLTPSLASKLKLPNEPTVIVDGVKRGSPVSSLVRPGDIIKKIDNTSVETVDDFAQGLKKHPKDKPIRLLVKRQNREFFVAFRK